MMDDSGGLRRALFVLMARMQSDDLPLRIFASSESLGHYLQFGKLSFDEEVANIAAKFKLPTSDLVCIESWEYANGVLVDIQHVMNFFETGDECERG